MSPTQARSDVGSAVTSAVDTLFEMATDAVDAAADFLGSEQGRRLRNAVATALIVGAPVISELPVVRRSPLARFMRTAAIGALVVKGAEWFRDWGPAQRTVTVRPPGRGRSRS